jgi:hypothetical protein
VLNLSSLIEQMYVAKTTLSLLLYKSEAETTYLRIVDLPP